MSRTTRLGALGVLIVALAACGPTAAPTPQASTTPAASVAAGSSRSTNSLPTASSPAVTGAEIVLGHYECQQFVTGSGWSYFGWVDIQAGGRYDSNGGDGTYTYDAGTGAVAFTGALDDNEFAGEYPKGSDNRSLRLFFYTDPDLLEIICSPAVDS